MVGVVWVVHWRLSVARSDERAAVPAIDVSAAYEGTPDITMPSSECSRLSDERAAECPRCGCSVWREELAAQMRVLEVVQSFVDRFGTGYDKAGFTDIESEIWDAELARREGKR